MDHQTCEKCHRELNKVLSLIASIKKEVKSKKTKFQDGQDNVNKIKQELLKLEHDLGQMQKSIIYKKSWMSVVYPSKTGALVQQQLVKLQDGQLHFFSDEQQQNLIRTLNLSSDVCVNAVQGKKNVLKIDSPLMEEIFLEVQQEDDVTAWIELITMSIAVNSIKHTGEPVSDDGNQSGSDELNGVDEVDSICVDVSPDVEVEVVYRCPGCVRLKKLINDEKSLKKELQDITTLLQKEELILSKMEAKLQELQMEIQELKEVEQTLESASITGWLNVNHNADSRASLPIKKWMWEFVILMSDKLFFYSSSRKPSMTSCDARCIVEGMKDQPAHELLAFHGLNPNRVIQINCPDQEASQEEGSYKNVHKKHTILMEIESELQRDVWLTKLRTFTAG